MNSTIAAEDLSVEARVGQIADAFLQQLSGGEQPDIEDYARRYPDIAAVLREALATLQLVRGAAPEPAPASEPATTGPVRQGCLGNFHLVREIGRGGMGVVYEAEQRALGRRVALKVLPRQAAQAGSGLERFRREAKAAARLHHSNIVPVYEVGEAEEVCYYAMEFIDGHSLARVIGALREERDKETRRQGDKETGRQGDKDGQPSNGAAGRESGSGVGLPVWVSPCLRVSLSCDFRTVARLGVQAAEALAHAHERGILHRDIKPANLMVDVGGKLWLTDFGLAKTDGAALTPTGDLVGTLRYMAPERFQGRSGPRSDVYSLGLTLYEMLLLRPAFEEQDRLRLLDQITHAEPPRPQQVDPRIPRDLETIVLKAIDKEPDRRYASAEALAEDLRHFLADEPIQARRTGGLERAWRWCRRNPLVAGLSAAVLVVAVAGFLGVLGQWQVALAKERQATASAVQAQEKEHEANQQRDEAQKQRDEVRVLNERLRRTLYAAHMNLAKHAWDAGVIGRVDELLEQHRPKPGETDLRGFEWYYLYRLCHSDLLTLAGHGVAYSPEGKCVAGPSKDTVKVRDAQTGQVLLTINSGWVSRVGVAFSPDGKRLAAGSGPRFTNTSGEVKVWDTQTGQELLTLKAGGHYDGLAFSPDGHWLASDAGSAVTIWDATPLPEKASPKPDRR